MKYLGYAWLGVTAIVLLLALYFGFCDLYRSLYQWSQRQREFRKSMRPFEEELKALRDASEGTI